MIMVGTAGSETLDFTSVASGDPAVHRLGWDTSLYDVFSDVQVNLSVDGAGGADTANFTDSTGGVVATLGAAGGTVTGLGYAVTLQNAETINVMALSGGQAYLYDSPGNDVFVSRPEYGYLSGTGFADYVQGLPSRSTRMPRRVAGTRPICTIRRGTTCL